MSARFYLPVPFRAGDTIELPEDVSRHAGLAKRMRDGEAITLFDGKGASAAGTLTFKSGRAFCEMKETFQKSAPKLKLTLIQALIAQEKLDFVLEKATELGVSKIVICPTKRSVVELSGARREKRLAQWVLKVTAACEQSGNDFVPEVLWADSLEVALNAASDEVKWILSPDQSSPLAIKGVSSAAFAVGPEGGFTDEELEIAIKSGFKPALLGPRILRTETAGLVALTVAQREAGDLH
ncbi:MAG TPA: 16S rRNA (uracil(1498)-N(3))-methyltransferase [Sutterella sp.]|nr:16S rRNA (uracil(1498)-N(3))-methyltransferase [Sutterella sp.]